MKTRLKQNKNDYSHLFHYTIDTLSRMINKSKLFEILSIKTFSIGTREHLSGGSIKSFDENPTGEGIHIRALLKKLDNKIVSNEHKYIDSIIQGKYHIQKSLE